MATTRSPPCPIDMPDVDVRDLRGRIGRMVVAAAIAVLVTWLAIGAVDGLTGERSSRALHDSAGLTAVGMFAGAVFIVAWATAVAARAARARRRERRLTVPRARARWRAGGAAG